MKLIIILSILLLSCNSIPPGQHCVKIGGVYKGIDGDLEYCYSAEKSKALGAPVFTGKEDLIGLTEGEIRSLAQEPAIGIKGLKLPKRPLVEILKGKDDFKEAPWQE